MERHGGTRPRTLVDCGGLEHLGMVCALLCLALPSKPRTHTKISLERQTTSWSYLSLRSLRPFRPLHSHFLKRLLIFCCCTLLLFAYFPFLRLAILVPVLVACSRAIQRLCEPMHARQPVVPLKPTATSSLPCLPQLLHTRTC